MKARINYKSRKTIIIIAIAVMLLALAIGGTVAFMKGNREAAAAMENREITEPVSEENNSDESQENTQNSENNQNNSENNAVTGENTATQDDLNTDNATSNNQNDNDNNNNQATNGTDATVPNQEYTQTTVQITEQPWEKTRIGWSPITVSAISASSNLGIYKANLQNEKLVYVGNDSLDQAPVTTVAQKGDVLTYVIKVTNLSDIDANNIKIYDSIPEGTEYIEGSISDNGAIENNDLSWKINIAKGETKTVSFKVTVISEEFSLIDNIAKVDGEDTNKVHTPIITKYKESELIVKDENGVETVVERDAKVGETIRYKINVVNTSEYAGTTSIYDIVPEGTTLVEDSISNEGIVETTTDENGIETKKIIWNNMQIEANDTTTVTFDVIVNEKKINPETLLEEDVKNVKNFAVVGNNETNEVEDKIANIKTIKTSVGTHKDGTPATEENPLHELDTITYTLTSTNYGEGEGSVVITDKLPDGTKLLSDDTTVESKIIDSDGNEYNEQQLETGITLTLKPEETKTITFTVIINAFEAAEGIEEDGVTVKHITNLVAKQDGTPIPGTDDLVEKEYKQVSVSKVFEDKENIDGLRPEFVLVGLFTDKDTEYTSENALATTTLKDNETYVFDKLDKYYLGTSEEITYDVKEIDVDENYSDSYETTVDEDNADNTTIKIKNTLKYENVPTSKTASKTWLDNGNPNRPTSVILAVYDGTEKVQEQEAKSDENGNWEVTFTDLQKYREDGTVIEYTFDEPSVPAGYVKVVEGNKIINKLPEIKVEKTIISVGNDPVDQDEASQSNVTVKTGDIVGYQIKVTNIGNVTLDNVTLEDVLENGGKVYKDKELKEPVAYDAKTKINTIVGYNDGLTLETIAPGNEATYTVYYQITDTDTKNVEENAELTNTVTAKGYYDVIDENGETVQNSVEKDDTAKVKFEREPSISIVKEQSVNGKKLAKNETKTKLQPDQVINYTITITNTGNTNLTEVDFTDVMNVSGNPRTVEITSVKVNGVPRTYNTETGRLDGILEVDDQLVITAKYKVKKETDISESKENTITNTATVDTEETTPKDSTVSVKTEIMKSIFTVSKKGYLKNSSGNYTIDANNKEVQAKDTIKYVLTVKNSGNLAGTYKVKDQDLTTLVNKNYVTAPTSITVKDSDSPNGRTISSNTTTTLYNGIDVNVGAGDEATVEFIVTVTSSVKPDEKISNTVVGNSTPVVNTVTKDIRVKSNIGTVEDANYVLLIDTSGSMVDKYVDDGKTTRFNAAKDAIRDFVKLLFSNSNTKSKISIIQFNVNAKIVEANDKTVFGVEDYALDASGNLTGTINTLINNISTKDGTNIQKGLEQVGGFLYHETQGIHTKGLTTNKKDVVILLSDGNPNYGKGQENPTELGTIATTQLIRKELPAIKNKVGTITNEIYSIALGSDVSRSTLQAISPGKVYSSTNRNTLYNAFVDAVYDPVDPTTVTLRQVSQVIYTGTKQLAPERKVTITYKGLQTPIEYTFTGPGTSSDGALKYENKNGTYSLTFNLVDKYVDKENILITYYVR